MDSLEPADPPAADQPQTDSTPTQNESSNVNPDVASIISEIMDHTERQEQTVAMGPQEVSPVGEFPGARGFAFLKANSHLKIQSLPILDNLVGFIDISLLQMPGILTLHMIVDSNSFLPVQEHLSGSHSHGVRAGI